MPLAAAWLWDGILTQYAHEGLYQVNPMLHYGESCSGIISVSFIFIYFIYAFWLFGVIGVVLQPFTGLASSVHYF